MFPELLTIPDGYAHIRQMLSAADQRRFVEEVRRVVQASPFFRPVFPRYGAPFKLVMTNCGLWGWVSSKERGMEYVQNHPVSGQPWPAMPGCFRELAEAAAARVGHQDFRAESCLINFYDGQNRSSLGLHCDDTEQDLSAPIISVSLGDIGMFGLGGMRKTEPVEDHLLESGDVVVMGGRSRLLQHEVKGIIPGSSCLLRQGGRLNLTIRTVTKKA